MKILITPRGFANYGMEEIRYMESKGFEVHYNNTGKQYTVKEFQKLGSEADGIIVGVDIIDKDFMEQCPKLKAICKFGVGTDNIDVAYAEEKGIAVGRTVGSNSLSVAEHVMAMIFSEAKNIYSTVKEVKEGKWNKPTGYEISGKSIGIIGFGAIGKHLAKIADGVGMKVFAYDVMEIPSDEAKKYNAEITGLNKIIENCDYVSLHLPLLESTKNMISTEEFRKMKNSACLINAARGGIADEKALYEALVKGEIRSACFDVYSMEPPEQGDKLLQLPNFFLTPHTGARTVESEKNTCKISMNFMLDNLL